MKGRGQHAAAYTAVQPAGHVRPLSADIASLLFKIALAAAIFTIVFSFVFGAFRCTDISMSPQIKDGDMIISYRLDKKFHAHDAVAFVYDGNRMASRVVAQAGDTVNITDQAWL
ncbi:S26 family signal peptidase [Collinsella sp. AGMB00827]|uniref:S26 family signal peptidase n=1 Tax=Collinsella ureilytica TaxID=2869515 RepID=A0ABS7MJ53_9ACTN|nr:S26 family signal peptidase [Collinsella urealyticum]